MESYNRLESFDFEVDNWDAYRERLEQLFHINGHAGSEEADLARRRAVLLTVCGKKPMSSCGLWLRQLNRRIRHTTNYVRCWKDVVQQNRL